jgi:phage shock protein PspC (stress-responsive transcriptional regulator)
MAAARGRGSLDPMSEHENAGGWEAWGAHSQPEPGQGPGPGARFPGAGPVRPPLRRDRRSRMVAGVCGGLGRHLDIDPVVFRILFVVLTFFGGFGLLAYAAAWLFVPVDGEDESEAHKLLTGRSALAAVAVAVLLVLGFMAMVSTLSNGFGHAVPLLVLATMIVTVLVWRGEGRRGPRGGAGFGPGAGGPGDPQQPKPWWQRPVPTSPAPGVQDQGQRPEGPGPDAPSPTPPTSPTSAGSTDWSRYQYSRPAYASADTSASAPLPRRLSGLTLSGALLALGILGVLAAAGAVRVGWTAGFALAVMAVGAGMVVGGFFGRARALIPVGLVLALPLIAAGALGVPLRGQTGDLVWAPVSASQVDSPYSMAAGRGRLDLTAVDPQGGTVQVTGHIGAGHLIVTVPDDVAVQVTAHVGFGQIQNDDTQHWSGIDLTRSFGSPAQGTSKGTIVLDLRVGAGDVEVDHVRG